MSLRSAAFEKHGQNMPNVGQFVCTSAADVVNSTFSKNSPSQDGRSPSKISVNVDGENRGMSVPTPMARLSS